LEGTWDRMKTNASEVFDVSDVRPAGFGRVDELLRPDLQQASFQDTPTGSSTSSTSKTLHPSDRPRRDARFLLMGCETIPVDGDGSRLMRL
jgi:hypothetical protein